MSQTKNQIQKFEKPSLVRKKAYTKARQELIDYIIESEGVNKKTAIKIANSEEEYLRVLMDKDKIVRMQIMNDMIPIAVKAFKDKAEKGSMSQAKETVTALGILKDKAMGTDKYSKPISIGGKNVQVNLGFDFKPYKQK